LIKGQVSSVGEFKPFSIMQFHSVVISEPIAQVAGLVSGLLAYSALHACAVAPNIQMGAAVGTSALVNLVLGAKLNIAMLDLLALLIVRPASVVAGAEAAHLVVKAISGT
jgi:hypothetical protein